MPVWLQLLLALGGLVWTLVSGFFGWALKEQWSMVRELQKDLARHREEVARDYVPRVDYKTDINRLFDKIEEVNQKLNGKEDRGHATDRRS